MSQSPTGKTVLVTGGAGFVGSHIADALCPDNVVWILGDSSTGDPANVPDGATVVEGDIRVEAALSATIVTHSHLR